MTNGKDKRDIESIKYRGSDSCATTLYDAIDTITSSHILSTFLLQF